LTKIKFWKVQACGNDFIMVNNTSGLIEPNMYSALAEKLCNRRFGIGADGIIFITDEPSFDFGMNYFNSDGSGPVMCGNGGRASIFFVAESRILNSREFLFLSSDGPHKGIYGKDGIYVTVKGGDAKKVSFGGKDMYFVDTGAPHVVVIEKGIDRIDIDSFAKPIREQFNSNVNLIEKADSGWKIRTFERGVEGETLSCGTGSVASAIVINSVLRNRFPIRLKAKGGELEVRFDGKYYWLGGDVKKVFIGEINL